MLQPEASLYTPQPPLGLQAGSLKPPEPVGMPLGLMAPAEMSFSIPSEQHEGHWGSGSLADKARYSNVHSHLLHRYS